jgi:hypothetical protein
MVEFGLLLQYNLLYLVEDFIGRLLQVHIHNLIAKFCHTSQGCYPYAEKFIHVVGKNA